MMTSTQAWNALTDNERFALLTRTELQRDNAIEYARELAGQTVSPRQSAQLRRLMDIGRHVEWLAIGKEPA